MNYKNASARISSAWKKLELDEIKIQEMKKVLSKEWVNVERRNIAYHEKKRLLEENISEKLKFLPDDDLIKLNIGGEIFTTSVKVWSRDRFSIIASLCTNEPIFQKDSSGCYFFDRDWWIFQYVFAYLRNNTLPNSLETLRELYYEASFYRIGLLRQAIEAYVSSKEFGNCTMQDSLPLVGLLDRDSYLMTNKNESGMNHNDHERNLKKCHQVGTLPDPFGFTSFARE